MKRYYYELMDEDYNSYEAAIPTEESKPEPLLKQSEQ